MESALPVAADHPAYPGHFPGNPILPGVVILAEVLAAVAASGGRPASGWTLANAKFLSPVTPGMPLTLSHEALASGGLRVEIESPQGLVATATLSPP